MKDPVCMTCVRAQSLCEKLIASGWPATCISGAQDQRDRLMAINKLKKFQCRVLISTDLVCNN
jgi:superfamily II DNA/RNA helicase